MICKRGPPRSIKGSRAQWFWAHQNQDALMLISASLALMASPNSPTRGHPKFPQAALPDYGPSAWMAKRAAASLSL